MAISPWVASTSLTFREAAALLSGLERGDLNRHDESQNKDFLWWMRRIDQASRKAQLVCRRRYGREDWGDNDLSIAHIEGSIKKSDLRDWLLRLGIADEAVPEAIRTYPQEQPIKAVEEPDGSDLHSKREATYQKVIATLIALYYGRREIEQPYPLAEELLSDSQKQDIGAPASRTTLGELFKDLPPVQKANLD